LYDLDAALKNLSEVACVGRTEYFDEDVASFIPTLAAAGIRLHYQQRVTENVGAPDFGLSLEQQLGNMRSQISATTWEQLHWFNQQDVALFEAVCRRRQLGEKND